MMRATEREGGLSFRRNFPGTPEKVRDVLGEIARLVTVSQFAPPVNSMWEVGLAEALNNVVEHAYKGCADGEILLDICFGSKGLSARIVDFGAPMPDGALPPGDATSLDVPMQEIPEGGFGWFLIRSLAEHLEYRRENGANQLDMYLPF